MMHLTELANATTCSRSHALTGSIPYEALLADGRREICKKALGEFGRLSATIVQRRCLVGYGRAMRILDALHYEGTINRADHRGWHFPSSSAEVTHGDSR